MTRTPRILFVDDEADVLQGLRLALRKQSREWDMAFAAGPGPALEALGAGEFDVVVTDMRMPGMDGATLLTRVRELQPDTIRIVLSGQADETLTIRAIPVSHQWLGKPCDRDALVSSIRKALTARALLDRPDLRGIVGRACTVRSFPKRYQDLMRVLGLPDFSMSQVAAVVERDPAMIAKVLQLANSALFGRRAEVVDLRQALSLLGLRTVTHLVLAADIFAAFRASEEIAELSFAELEARAVRISRLASKLLADDPEAAQCAATAGILHDIGTLVLLHEDAARLSEALRLAARENLERSEAERAVFGVDHAQVAGATLSAWGLPTSVVLALTHHHDPKSWEHVRPDVAAALHVAETLVCVPQAESLLRTRLLPHGLGARFENWIAIGRTEVGALS